MANPATDWAELDAPRRGRARERLRQGRAQGDDRAQAAQRLRPQARVRHAAQGAPRRPVERAARRARRLVAPRRLAAAHLRQPARQDAGVKAKIDEIEQQMVGDSYASTQRRAPEFYNAPTQPAPLDLAAGAAAAPRRAAPHGGRVEDFARAAGAATAPVTSRRRRAAGAAAASRAASIAPIQLELPPAEDFGQAVRRRQHRGHPRPRPRRGGDRLRQRRLRAVRAVAVSAHRPRRQPRRSTPRPGWCCSTCTARPASSTSSRAWRSTTRSSSAGRRRSGSRCPSWSPRRPSEERPSGAARRGPGRLGLPRRTSTPTASPSSRRWRCRCRCPGCSTGARCRRIDAEACGRAVGAVPQLDPQDLDMRWLARRAPVHGAAGSGAHRRPRRRPGVLAAAPRRAAHDQPPRPVRRGGDRLLRHLRGLAAVVGAGALPGRASAARTRARRAAAVGGERRLDQLPRVAAAPTTPASVQVGDGRALGPAGRRHRRRR